MKMPMKKMQLACLAALLALMAGGCFWGGPWRRGGRGGGPRGEVILEPGRGGGDFHHDDDRR
jgi:hypothetical protein